MSAQQLALELDDARASAIAVWGELPAGTRTEIVTAMAGLVARILEAERDE